MSERDYTNKRETQNIPRKTKGRTRPTMARNVYRYQCKDRDWTVKDPRLSLHVLFLKWETWTQATRTTTTGPDTGPDHNERTEHYANRFYK